MRSEYDLQKVTKGHVRSQRSKNRHYTQIKGNRKCDRNMTSKRSPKVIQGQQRSKIDIILKLKVIANAIGKWPRKRSMKVIQGHERSKTSFVVISTTKIVGGLFRVGGRAICACASCRRPTLVCGCTSGCRPCVFVHFAIVHIVRVHLRLDLRPCRRCNLLLFIFVHLFIFSM